MTIKINTTTVTDEQIAKCHRIVDGQTNEVFYMVESEEEKFNEDGSRVEYKVTWDSVKKVFHCTCASGAEGFRSCTFHATCKHCRWAVAAAIQYKQEQDALKASYPSEKQMELMARQSRIEKLVAMGLSKEQAVKALESHLMVDGKEADDATLVRVFSAKPKQREVRPGSLNTNRGFSLMR